MEEFLKNMDNFKISIEGSENGKCKVNVEGTKFAIMNGLSNLANNLVNNTNLKAADIKYAIEVGLMTEQERKKESEKLISDTFEKLKKLFE